jgi:hypothetical protein
MLFADDLCGRAVGAKARLQCFDQRSGRFALGNNGGQVAVVCGGVHRVCLRCLQPF